MSFSTTISFLGVVAPNPQSGLAGILGRSTTIVSRAIRHWKGYVPSSLGAVIVNWKLRGAPGATLPETAMPPTPQSWPTGLSTKIVLVVVTADCVTFRTTVLSHVVVPVFDILTVTVALSFGFIVIGTLEYDTNAELSPPLAAPAVNAKTKNSPAAAEWRNAARRVLSALETNMRPPTSPW